MQGSSQTEGTEPIKLSLFHVCCDHIKQCKQQLLRSPWLCYSCFLATAVLIKFLESGCSSMREQSKFYEWMLLAICSPFCKCIIYNWGGSKTELA